MSSSSLRRSSISKQRGAEMSSRLIPPKVGAISLTVWMISSGSLVARQIGKASTSRELLEEHRLALHHRHRRLGADVAEAEDGGAVGDHRDGVRLDREVEGLGLVLGDVLADAGHAGRVRHREVVAGLQRVLVVLLDLALLVHLEGAIGEAEHACAPGGADRAQDLLPVLGAVGVDRELANALALGSRRRGPGRPDERAAGLGDLRRQLAERLLARVELDADGDAVLSGGSHGALIIGGASSAASPGTNTGNEGEPKTAGGGTNTGNEGERDRSWRLTPGMGEEPANTDRVIAKIAARQHGVVSAAQLRARRDRPDRDITRRVQAGRLHRLHRGVYAVGHTRLSFEGRCMAAVLALGEGQPCQPPQRGGASGACSGRMHGPIDVTRPGGRRPGEAAGASASTAPTPSLPIL